jgi:hypothetical protein
VGYGPGHLILFVRAVRLLGPIEHLPYPAYSDSVCLLHACVEICMSRIASEGIYRNNHFDPKTKGRQEAALIRRDGRDSFVIFSSVSDKTKRDNAPRSPKKSFLFGSRVE